MTNHSHSIAIKQLPQTPTSRQELAFLSSLESALTSDRPRIVLDCSGVELLDRPTLQLMLCCLEEAMKRNGDVKLAAVAPAPMAVLKEIGASHLFEFHTTGEAAVKSFHRTPASKSAAGGHSESAA